MALHLGGENRTERIDHWISAVNSERWTVIPCEYERIEVKRAKYIENEKQSEEQIETIKSGRMSGLGPAACWLAHKRIESWSRLAKERVGAVRKPAADKNDGTKSSNASTSMNMSTDSNNDSFASTEVIFHTELNWE